MSIAGKDSRCAQTCRILGWDAPCVVLAASPPKTSTLGFSLPSLSHIPGLTYQEVLWGWPSKHTPNVFPFSTSQGSCPSHFTFGLCFCKSFWKVLKQESGHLLQTSSGLPTLVGAKPKPSGWPAGASAHCPWVTLLSPAVSAAVREHARWAPRTWLPVRPSRRPLLPPGSLSSRTCSAAGFRCATGQPAWSTVSGTAPAGFSPYPLNFVLITELVTHVIYRN